MTKYYIRRIKDDDIDFIKQLWELHFGKYLGQKRAISFDLILKSNPFCPDGNGYYVMEIKGNLIAYCGIMPSKFFIYNGDYEGFIYQDSMVDPAYRGKGIATILCKEMVSILPEFSIAVWMNAPNARVFEKSGWKPVQGLYTFVRGYDTRSLLKTDSKFLNNLLFTVANPIISFFYKIEKLFYLDMNNKHNLLTIDQFDSTVDKLFHSVKYRYGFISYRTMEVLNWKYSNKRVPGCVKIVCMNGNEMLGYLIYKTRTVENGKILTTIFDYLCSPEREDVFKSLLKKALLKIEKEKTHSIEIICANRAFVRILKRFAFVKSKDNPFALKYIHEDKLSNSSMIDITNIWHFTHGDGDKIFWEI